ncbi:Hypothetical predicted protein [Cloeon dipterum]|uniref:Uncharacterized protein n=1 Tax=Cloeon dipterum TaxID=197152 RepID=A0A8S1C5I7_9INSE|nr:Hypothetical predicted protein [Cloeon dipterum]
MAGKGNILHDSQEPEERPVGWKADLLAKVLAAVSAVSFSVFVLALMAVTDPLTASVLGRFRASTCVLVQSDVHRGATLCRGWSSCKNLCADPPVLYNCFHLVVRVFPQNDTLMAVTEQPNRTLDLIDVETLDPDISPQMSARLQLFPPSLEIFGYKIYGADNTSAQEEEQEEGFPVRFFVNAAGCGYGLNCSSFQQRFASVGSSFPCLYSRLLNRTMPMDERVSEDDVWVASMVAPAVPAVVSMASLAYLCIRGHCDLPRLVPRNVLIRMIKRRRTRIRKQIRLMQKRGSIRSNFSLKSSAAPDTPQSLEWKKRPPPSLAVHLTDDKPPEQDLVVQVV